MANGNGSVHPKVIATAAGGAFVTVLSWVLLQFFKIDIPDDVAVAITTFLVSALAYLTPSPLQK